MPSLEETAKIVAYQKSHLLTIRQLYESLHVDLDEYLASEQEISRQIHLLEQGLSDVVQGNLPSLDSPVPQKPILTRNPPKRYPLCDADSSNTLDELVIKAEAYLRRQHIDLEQDPLLQVLNAPELLSISESYRKKYGIIGWEREDYVIVSLAGFIGTLLDLLLVKVPENSKFLIELPQGYALATWLRKHAMRLREEYLTPIKSLADTRKQQDKEEQDTLLAFISALLDIVRYSGTSVNEHGNIVAAKRLSSDSEEALTRRFSQALLPVLNRVLTSVGLQSLLEHFSQKEDVFWQEVTAYLHQHGYNVKDLLIMGIVPSAIELIVKGYWFLKHFETQENVDRLSVKLTSMLLLSHTLALSGQFIKSGLFFRVDPMTLNWEHILRCVPLFISWINQGIERENVIRAALDEEWVQLYKQNS